MKLSRWVLWVTVSLAGLLFYGCSQSSTPLIEVRRYPVQDTDGVVDQAGVTFDSEISSDGNGSLRIACVGPTTVQLYETGDIDVEDARLTYSAKVRTSNLVGKAYLEMRCCFAGKGEFFSRDLRSPLSGTTDWSSEETPFFLQKGENPDNVKLNLVIDGAGTVWIDDLRLSKGPLK
jgi:hypothetical protein